MTRSKASDFTLRTPLGFFPFAVMIAATVGMLSGSSHDPRSAAEWIDFGWGLGMAVCFYGLWWAHDWARRASGILAIAGLAILLIKIIVDASIDGSNTLAMYHALGIPLCAALAWYSSRPRTKEAVRTVRDAIAHARAVPG